MAVNKWQRIIIWLDSRNAYWRYWLHDNVVHNMSYTWSVHKSGFPWTSPGWWWWLERYLKIVIYIHIIVHNIITLNFIYFWQMTFYLFQWLCALRNGIFMNLWRCYDMDNDINKITRSIMFGRVSDHSGLVTEESDSLREMGLLRVKVFRALILLSSTMDKT